MPACAASGRGDASSFGGTDPRKTGSSHSAGPRAAPQTQLGGQTGGQTTCLPANDEPTLLAVLGQHADEAVAEALRHFPELADADAAPLGNGLINETYEVKSSAGRFVLQRLNGIFDPAIHHNIRAVTDRLRDRGLPTPRLVPSDAGRPWIDLAGRGIWRLQTYIEGASFDRATSPAQVKAAGGLVARFHDALDGLPHRFVGMRTGIHDTPKHLAALRSAVAETTDHRLHAAVAELGEAILHRAQDLAPLPSLPPRLCHGDLKFNNVRFAGSEPPQSDRAMCLIDLDTLGPMSLAYELGDAWRSWCNPGGEGIAEPSFDIDLFEAAWLGYRDGLSQPLGADQRRALLGGVEWISLELAARFAADALQESYFGWDEAQYPAAGEHNLVRARSQWALHQAVVASRRRRAELLEVALRA